MSYQAFPVVRRNPARREVFACSDLRELLNEIRSLPFDCAALEAAVVDLEAAARSYEQSRSDFGEKSSRLQDSLHRYDVALELAMVGENDLDRLFDRTGALESAGEEFRGALSERGEARMAAQSAIQRIALLLARMDVQNLGASARETLERANAELDRWRDRLSDAHPAVSYAMLPAARWRRIA